MLQEIKFANQTGNLGFAINFRPTNTTGNWQVAIGATGNSEMALTFSGNMGRIYDEDGYFVCGYGIQEVNIHGVIETGHYAYYTDGIVTKCKGKPSFDLNYATFNTTSSENPIISISGSESVFDDKSILFLTNDEDADADWIEFINYMVTDITVSSSFTGVSISGRENEVEEYDAVVFGEIGASITEYTGIWHSLDIPKIVLSPTTAENLGLLEIIGSGSVGVTGLTFIENPACASKIDLVLGGLLVGTGDNYLFPALTSPSFVDTWLPTKDSVIGWNASGVMIDEFSSGEDFVGEVFSNRYYLFNTPSGLDYLTDSTRQIITNTLRLALEGKSLK